MVEHSVFYVDLDQPSDLVKSDPSTNAPATPAVAQIASTKRRGNQNEKTLAPTPAVPARYDDLLTLTTTTERLTPVRVDHGYVLRRGGELLAEARSTLVAVGRDGRPRALPDDVYAQLAGVTEPRPVS